MEKHTILVSEIKPGEAFAELEHAVYAALETYSNVHRGSGHMSMVTTHLYDQAREIVLEYLGLKSGKYVVIFCTPRREVILRSLIKPEKYKSVSSKDVGLPLGVRALVIEKKALPEGAPFQTGGGTTKLVSSGWVIWDNEPNKFEAGTPAIINVIAFAKGLKIIKRFGNDAFQVPVAEKITAAEILFNDEMKNYSGIELLDELRQSMIGMGILVPTVEGNKRFINLDNGASTPTFIPIWNTVCKTWRQTAHVQHDIVQEVRSICSGLLGAPLADYDMIFTSNTTEAINMAAESLGNEYGKETKPVVLSTILEHTSNDLPWRTVPNVFIIRLSVDNEGFIDLSEMEKLLSEYNEKDQHGTERIRLVAVSGASNVLGICNRLAEISKIVHKYGARLFVDGAQLVAHRKIETGRWGIDYLAFSAHKVYAPFGTGVLVVRKGLLKFGTREMELIQSSGEENTIGIAALGKSLSLLQSIGLDLIREEEQALAREALHGLAHIPDLTIYGIKDPESPGFAQKGGVIVFSIKGMLAPRIAKELAERGGIGVRSGCHCAHILVKHLVGVPPAFERFQWLISKLFPKLRFPGIVRVSFGIENSKEDIDTLIHILGKIVSKSRILQKTDLKRQINGFIITAAERVYIQI